jgi:hypothetical protein
MRNVEHPGGAPNGVVFLDLGTVVQRHLPAGEIDESRAQFPVQGVQRSSFSHVRQQDIAPSERPPAKRERGEATRLHPCSAIAIRPAPNRRKRVAASIAGADGLARESRHYTGAILASQR